MDWKIMETYVPMQKGTRQQIQFEPADGFISHPDYGMPGFARVYPPDNEGYPTRHYAIQSLNWRNCYIGPETRSDSWSNTMYNNMPTIIKECTIEMNRKAEHQNLVSILSKIDQNLVSILGKIEKSLDTLAKYVIHELDRIEVTKFAEDIEKNGVKPITID